MNLLLIEILCPSVLAKMLVSGLFMQSIMPELRVSAPRDVF
jgi:hypothetical protein